jgi:hypothetical protein
MSAGEKIIHGATVFFSGLAVVGLGCMIKDLFFSQKEGKSR